MHLKAWMSFSDFAKEFYGEYWRQNAPPVSALTDADWAAYEKALRLAWHEYCHSPEDEAELLELREVILS